MMPYFPLVLKNIHLHKRWVCLRQGMLTRTSPALATDKKDKAAIARIPTKFPTSFVFIYRVRLSKRRAKGGGGIQSATNAVLAVKHREMHEQELAAQEMRRIQLEPLEPDDEEEEEEEETANADEEVKL